MLKCHTTEKMYYKHNFNGYHCYIDFGNSQSIHVPMSNWQQKVPSLEESIARTILFPMYDASTANVNPAIKFKKTEKTNWDIM